jgi:tetratricopeptide (TPR) repeat protein
MKVSRHLLLCCVTLTLVGMHSIAYSQQGFQVDVKKPPLYENRVLKAEKTKEGKLKQPKKFFQNLTNRFNYVFNANNKLNEVIDRAKQMHKDDYFSLLSFYNYSLDATRADSMDLDSVIYKAQTGVLMHDLRNQWNDDLYLLWGAAYYLERKFDSAAMMLQFVNYSYAEKEKDGYYKYIGSHEDGQNTLTISTKEKKGVFPTSASRNNAFVWQVRTLTEMGRYAEAGSLITTIKNDPNFPARLNNGFEEAQAYWFYKQERWDSSAAHLVIAAEGQRGRQEKARWEYLAAQMYEKAGKLQEAQDLYAKAIGHTTDPVLEVIAMLNRVRVNKSADENYVDKNIAQLVSMAHKEKFEDYRDIIYYMAAQMEMDRNHLDAARELLLQGSKYNNGNLSIRTKAFLQIADLSYTQKKYRLASSYYDSVRISDLNPAELERVNDRRPPLKKVTDDLNSIQLQDSLQKIAAMPEAERTAFLTKLAKRLRKEQGLKDEKFSSGVYRESTNTSLFNSTQKGEWYFYNTALKSQGESQFRQVWGDRPNVDNWRRIKDVSTKANVNLTSAIADVASSTSDNAQDNEITASSLAATLPMTAETLKASNDKIKAALHSLGGLYLNDLNDYSSAIEVLEELRTNFPDYDKMDEVLFSLYYAYVKSGERSKAASIRKLLQDKFPSSRFTAIATTGEDPVGKSKETPASTREYERIYNMFLEGKFAEAETAKVAADSVYKTNYWQPQLLYIQAVYHARQREDSMATNILKTLIAQGNTTPLGKKAQNLLDVLSRRQKIEDDLNRYQMQQPSEPVAVAANMNPMSVQQVVKDTVSVKKQVANNPPVQKRMDTVAKVVTPPPALTAYTFNANTVHYAVVILNKVDPVFVNEAKNAFNRFSKEKFYNLPLDAQVANLNADTRLVLIGNFPNAQAAVDYAKAAKKIASSEIVPWLTADKYAFSVISPANLELLKGNPDLNAYSRFINQNLPGIF